MVYSGIQLNKHAMHTLPITEVDKSQLASISFGKNERADQETYNELRHDLDRALSLGNLHKSHAMIQFRNKQGDIMETRATIWAVSDEYIMIKGGICVPIESIVGIEIWNYPVRL